MNAHCLGQDKAPQKKHDDRVGKRSESTFNRGNLEYCQKDGNEKSGDWNRQTLCYPPGDDQKEYGEKNMSFWVALKDGKKISKKEENRKLTT